MEETVLQLFRQGMPPSEIDRTLRLPEHTAHRVITETWLADKAKPEKQRKQVRRRLTDELVRAIRATKGKLFVKDAAEKYGVSESSVRRIWSGESYGYIR